MILLDSDVMIDLLRQHQPAVDWLTSLETEEIGLPGFVVMELIQGCKTKVQQRRLEQQLTLYEILWPSAEICNSALTVFARFHLSHNLGMIDALIGQMAVSLAVPLCTFNRKHYAVIPGIQMLQPYTR